MSVHAVRGGTADLPHAPRALVPGRGCGPFARKTVHPGLANKPLLTAAQVPRDLVTPIHAAIRVFEPKLFAVTMERPGGVVVSKGERIVLTAS